MSNNPQPVAGSDQRVTAGAVASVSNPVTVVASLAIQPGHEADARRALKQAVQQTQSENGCLRYELFEDLQDPLKMVMLEVWQDSAALQAHAQGSAFKTLVAAIGDTVRIDVTTLRPVN